MINPLIPYAMRGVIWYQGESNSDRAWQYNYLFKTLITDWRQKWGEGDFPFLFVQLASFMVRNAEPVDDTWAELRESQANALQLPNTGMAVTIDIGDAKDIHPGNKQEVGKRLAGVALNEVYKQPVESNSPRFSKMEESGNAIELSFCDIYEGLKTSDNEAPKGFAVAGDDYKFVWAKAEIVGEKIRVWSDEIKRPVAVRYGWSANPDVNVVNSAGLPLCPFRTDKLPEITKGKY
jgi:sialate O-acetylesterase